MIRVGRALLWHEFLERTRDRWVIVVSLVFALMAAGVSLYGSNAAESAAMVTGPSLVTLSSMLVPLVALILGHDLICGERERNTLGLLLSLPAGTTEIVVAKFLGRMFALVVSVSIGLGCALPFAGEGGHGALLALIGPAILLGGSFLAMGSLISAITNRPSTAASLAVVTWFLLVFFYDLALLGILVLTDGAFPADVISGLVAVNPAGLFRVEMMALFAGDTGFEDLNMGTFFPGKLASYGLWALWIFGVPLLTTLILSRRKSVR